MSSPRPDTAVAPAPRRRGRRILLVLGVLVVLLAGASVGGFYLVGETLGGNVDRVHDVFGPLQVAQRPDAGPGETFLVVGTDTRSAEPTTGSDAPAGVDAGSQRSDVIMLAQLAADRKSASVVSIPRDSWVDVPGRGQNKINAAYAFGGPSLLVATVEKLTGVRVDHFAVVDFAGFQAMVDAVGGIDVKVAAATSNGGVAFQEGLNHLDGPAALAYVRQRHGLPGGDLDRAHREQAALKALLSKAAAEYAHPVELYRLIDATSRTVSIDDTLSNGGLRDLALSAAGLRPSTITFLNAPVASFGREGAQSVDYLDGGRSAELWADFRGGSVGAYAAKYPADRLADIPA